MSDAGPFNTYFDNELFSDITLILCEQHDQRLSVHRIILAAHSEFFRAALSGSFTESTTTEIPLHFSDSANVLCDVIRSLYEVPSRFPPALLLESLVFLSGRRPLTARPRQGHIKVTFANAIPILVAAEQLQITALKVPSVSPTVLRPPLAYRG